MKTNRIMDEIRSTISPEMKNDEERGKYNYCLCLHRVQHFCGSCQIFKYFLTIPLPSSTKLAIILVFIGVLKGGSDDFHFHLSSTFHIQPNTSFCSDARYSLFRCLVHIYARHPYDLRKAFLLSLEGIPTIQRWK